jgi:hypothetical protein
MLSWSQPNTGTPPFTYVVRYKVSSSTIWLNYGGTTSATSMAITGLLPQTSYDFDIVTSDPADG